MSLEGRLRRLEDQGDRCPECGLTPDERRPLAVIWEEQPERGFKGDPHERCNRCQEPLYTVLRVVYEGRGRKL